MSSRKKTKDVKVFVRGVVAETKVGRVASKGISRGPKRGRGKYEYEILKGDEFNSEGRIMQKERIVDHQNDRYMETVIDAETGEIVRKIDEPLSKHVGRGSARSKGKPP